MTFKEARAHWFNVLMAEGWTLHLKNSRTFDPLKVPYAVKSGYPTLWFNAQSIVYGVTYKSAHSLISDMRDIYEIPRMLDYLEAAPL
jgi:hypothetical protein